MKFGFGFCADFFSVPLPNPGRVESVKGYQQKINIYLVNIYSSLGETCSADLMVGVARRKCGVLCGERFDVLIT